MNDDHVGDWPDSLEEEKNLTKKEKLCFEMGVGNYNRYEARGRAINALQGRIHKLTCRLFTLRDLVHGLRWDLCCQQLKQEALQWELNKLRESRDIYRAQYELAYEQLQKARKDGYAKAASYL